MSGRSVAWIGGAAVLATWFVAAAGQDAARRSAPSPPPGPPPPTESERAAADIQSQAARLRERLQAAPAPADAGRNPFLFAQRTPLPEPRETFAVAAGNPAIGAEAPPPFTLSGIATDEGSDGPVRIAVLSGFGDVYLARAGETIASRYEVVAVGADAVELRDLADGRVVRIGLP